MSAFGILGFSFLEFTSLDCLLNWTYFEKLVFATVFPFVVILLIASIYLGVWMKCYAEAFRRDRDRVLANTMYFALLVFYVTLPVASSWTFGYFNCVSFDRGDGENDLKVLMADPSVKCTSPRYHAWFAYVIFSCLVWPIGMPLGVGVLLWRNRRRLNPIIPDNYLARRSSSGTVEHTQAFQRERLRHKIAMQQLAKLDIRDKDKNLRFLEFVFEEYEPRCYMFPVFEILRRIFLTAMLMAFYPGSMTQVVVGMLASMISFTVYNHYEPYIEDDDDVVSAVAQTQLILVYFAAFVVYASENMDSKEGVFSSDAFGVFLILLFLASFVVAISTIFLELWGYTALSNHLDATRHTFMSRSSSLFTSLRRQQTSSPRKQDSSLKDLRSSLSSQSSLSRKSSIGSIRNDPEAPGEEVVSEQTTGDIVGVALLDNDDDEVPEKPHPKDRTSFEDGKAELSQ